MTLLFYFTQNDSDDHSLDEETVQISHSEFMIGAEVWLYSLRNVQSESKGGAVVKALASRQCGPGSNPGVDCMCVELVVGSLLCSERVFSRYSGFPLSLKTNFSKFQFDME